MKKRTKNILIGIGIFFVLFFTVGGHFINKYYNEYVKSRPQMYCYEYFRGTSEPVSVLILEDLDRKAEYIEYYQKIQKGEKATLNNNFPIKGMPQYSPVYVLEYTEDSLLAKVVSYYDRGAKFGGSFTKGWVYAETLHENPPPKKDEK